MTASVSANPPDISDLVTARDAFTQSQIDRLERYAEHWANELASGQSDRMNRARRELLDQLRAPGVRRIFLDEYARAVVPQMQRLIERDPQMDGSQFIAINAIQIIGMLQSEMAVRPLLEYANPEREDRSAIRLWAVNGFRLVVESGNVTDRRTDGFVRDLHRLAERETDWMVLMRHFQAMAVVQTEVARERQVELLSRVVSRIEEDESGPSELMRVVSQSLLLLREQYISPTISASEQTTLGRSLGPVLGRILAVADQHWDAAKANESSREQYGSAIRIAEILLRAVDSRVRSGSSVDEAIEQAWSSNNQSQYRSGVSRWQSVLSRSPYSQ
ncbi:MAG: hypothetical protein EA377_11950 [Phycisphaerales bacterium]|nr:MAG: hypothetical protein EA377_11950 [Phycisphaerales bacterium]